MSVYLLINTIALLLCLQLGAYIYFTLPVRWVNFFFLLASLLYALVSLGILLANLSPETNVNLLYERVAISCMMGLPVVFCFMTYYLHKKWKKVLAAVIRYFLLPALIILLWRFHVYPVTFYEISSEHGAWSFNFYPLNIWRLALIVFYSICAVVILFQVILWLVSATSRRSKHQAVLVLLATVFLILSAMTSDLFLPMLGFSDSVFMSHLLALPALAVMAYALIALGAEQFTDKIIRKLIVKHINGHIIVFDAGGHVIYANQHTLSKLGYGQFSIQELKITQLFADRAACDFICQKARLNQNLSGFRAFLTDHQNHAVAVEISTIPLYDRLKRYVGFVVTGIDVFPVVKLESRLALLEENKLQALRENRAIKDLIASRKQELARVKTRLGYDACGEKTFQTFTKLPGMEKSKLVQEMHHRVKNNLQIVLSLVNMIRHDAHLTSHNEETLNSITSRVLFLSEAHDSFYSSPFISKIDFSAYVRQYFDAFQTQHNTKNHIKYSLSTQQVMLNIQQALPCAIILKEMLENAHQHAFPDHFLTRVEGSFKPGIWVSCTSTNDQISLYVLDNGIGHSPPVSEWADGVGMSIIRQLSSEFLRGSVKVLAENGTFIEVSFKALNPL